MEDYDELIDISVKSYVDLLIQDAKKTYTEIEQSFWSQNSDLQCKQCKKMIPMSHVLINKMKCDFKRGYTRKCLYCKYSN